MDDGSGHHRPLEWHPGPYGYDPYTNTFLPLPCYGYGWGVEYSWNPPVHQQGHMQYSSSSVVPLGMGRPPQAGAQRGRGRGGRGGRHGFTSPRQHGGRGPSQPLQAKFNPSSSQPSPAQGEAQPPPVPVPVPLPPPENKDDPSPPPAPVASSSPSSPPHVMTPPVSDPVNPPAPVKNSQVVDVSMTDAADKTDDAQAQDDVLSVGLDGSSSSNKATADKKRQLPLHPPAPSSMTKNSEADVSMARRDGVQSDDVLGLSGYLAKKRLLSTKASLVDAAAAAGEEETKAAATKKTRLAWGQGLAKYENRSKKDVPVGSKGHGLAKYENRPKKDGKNTHKLVAHDRAIGEPASSHGSSRQPGSQSDGDNNSLDIADEMKVSQVTTVPAFSKGSSRPLTGDLGDPGKNGSIGSLTEKAVSPAKLPAGFSRKHSASLARDAQMSAGSSSNPYNSSFMSSSSMTAIAMSELPSSQRCNAPDESGIKFTKVQDIPPQRVITECSNDIQHNPRKEGQGKVVVQLVHRPRIILDNNVFSDNEEQENNELMGSKLKKWSQEEKDVFSELITAFGMNFPKIASFLSHKTAKDCMDYYHKQYKSESQKEAHKCLPATVVQSQENCCNENDAATVAATKSYGRMKAEAEDVKKPVNQICHESTANVLPHSLPDKGHGESYMGEDERVTGKPLVGESNAAPSPLGIRSSQSACLTISKTEAPVLENFNEESCSSESVCITKSWPKVKENVPQSVLIENHADEGNYVAGGSCGQDTVTITFFADEISAKLANGTIKIDQIRSGDKTSELSSSLKEWKATEKVANSNTDDGSKAPSDMKTPKSKDNPCITSDPAMLTGPAFVEHMMKAEKEMERRDSEQDGDKVKGMEGNNPVLCVGSKEPSGFQLSCKVNSQKEIEKLDSIPSPEGKGLNADMENPTKDDSSPCVATNATVVRDDLIQRLKGSEAMYTYSGGTEDVVKSKEGCPVHIIASKECNGIQSSCNVTAQKRKGIIPSPKVNDLNAPPMQNSNGAPKTYHLPSSSSSAAVVRDDLIPRLRASEEIYTYSGGNEDKVKSKEGNPVHIVASKECNGTQFSCNVTAHQKGKGIISSSEVNDLNAPPMHISNGAPETFHLPSSSGSAVLDIVQADSSYVAMDIDLNIPLDVAPLDMTMIDLENSHADASMGPSDDSDATIEMEISSLSQTITAGPRTAHKQPANQPGSIMLFGRVISQAPSTGTTSHTPNQGNQIVISSSSNVPSNQVVPVTRRRGIHLYPSGAIWSSGVLNNQQGQQAAVLANRMAYSGSTNNGASISAASPIQPRSSALVNMINQQRQQALLNITPHSILRGGVPVPSHHLIQGSSSGGGPGLINFNGFNPSQQQWPLPILDTSRLVIGYPFYYPGATANQAPATAATITSIGRNNGGEGASTSNTRAPPAAGRGRGGGRSSRSWLSLGRE